MVEGSGVPDRKRTPPTLMTQRGAKKRNEKSGGLESFFMAGAEGAFHGCLPPARGPARPLPGRPDTTKKWFPTLSLFPKEPYANRGTKGNHEKKWFPTLNLFTEKPYVIWGTRGIYSVDRRLDSLSS